MPLSSKLHVEPLSSLLDRTVEIRASLLPPGAMALFEASMIDRKGVVWSSFALFVVDEEGKVNLAHEVPIEGSYTSADPMGLFWSMRPVREDADPMYSSHDWEPIEVTIALKLDGELVAERKILRLKTAPQVQRTEIRHEGIFATLFEPPGAHLKPAVIAIGGSDAGIREGRAALLAAHGFVTLAVGYFGVEGLPTDHREIPIEYFVKATQWLRTHSGVDPKRVGAIGISRGSEALFLTAFLYPDLYATIVAIVPSCAVYPALPDMKFPAWTHQGKAVLPPAPITEVDEGGEDPKHPLKTTPWFLEGMDHTARLEEAMIPVEKIICPLMLISAGDDQVWPSAQFSEMIMGRLSIHQSSIERVHLSYAHAGHYIAVPNLPVTQHVVYHRLLKRWVTFGGTPEAQANACSDSWPRLVAFLKTHL